MKWVTRHARNWNCVVFPRRRIICHITSSMQIPVTRTKEYEDIIFSHIISHTNLWFKIDLMVTVRTILHPGLHCVHRSGCRTTETAIWTSHEWCFRFYNQRIACERHPSNHQLHSQGSHCVVLEHCCGRHAAQHARGPSHPELIVEYIDYYMVS